MHPSEEKNTNELTVSICENFMTFFPLNMIPWYSKHILFNGEGA